MLSIKFLWFSVVSNHIVDQNVIVHSTRPQTLPLWVNYGLVKKCGVGGAVKFLVVGTIGKEERPPRGQLWMEQYLISLKYWPI